MNPSPLILYLTLAIAALWLDNYSNRYEDFLNFSLAEASDNSLPYSFRFHAWTLSLLVETIAPRQQHKAVHALANLITGWMMSGKPKFASVVSGVSRLCSNLKPTLRFGSKTRASS
jgi:hypothetical protein